MLQRIVSKKINALREPAAGVAEERSTDYQTRRNSDAPRNPCNETATFAKFAIEMRYKNQMRRTELPLSQDMVGKLALEAELRKLKLGELLAKVILGLAQDKLLELVLDRGPWQPQPIDC